MFIILKTIIFLIIVNFGSGFIISKLLKTREIGFFQVSLYGMMGIIFIETLCAFFVPLDYKVEITLFILGLSGFLWFIKGKAITILEFRKNLDFWFWIFASVSSAVSLLAGCTSQPLRSAARAETWSPTAPTNSAGSARDSKS